MPGPACEKIGWNKLVLLRVYRKVGKKVEILTHQNFSPHWRPPQLLEGTSDLPQNSTQKGLWIVTFFKKCDEIVILGLKAPT